MTAKDIRAWENSKVAVQRDDIVLVDFQWEPYWKPGPERESVSLRAGQDCRPADAAGYLVERRVKLVGTYCVSLDPGDGGGGKLAAHYTLLPSGILILENVSNLGKLPPVSFFMALPLKIENGTGSPVRAVVLVPKQ